MKTLADELYLVLIDRLAIGLLVLLAGYFVSRALKDFEGRQALRRELDISRNKAALEQLEAQIKELYSPLYGLIQRTHTIYKIAQKKLQSLREHGNVKEEGESWRYFVEKYFLPINAQMADTIRSRIYLIEEDELPPALSFS